MNIPITWILVIWKKTRVFSAKFHDPLFGQSNGAGKLRHKHHPVVQGTQKTGLVQKNGPSHTRKMFVLN
jgi:hypothetical protein